MVVEENHFPRSITHFYLNFCFLAEMCGIKEGGKLFLQLDTLIFLFWEQNVVHGFRLTLYYFHGFLDFVSPSKWLFSLKTIMVNSTFRKTIALIISVLARVPERNKERDKQYQLISWAWMLGTVSYHKEYLNIFSCA